MIVTGSFTDPSPVDRHVVEVSWGDGQITNASVNALNRTFTASYRYRDNFAAAQISATVTDGRFASTTFQPDGGSDTSDVVLQTVTNVAPSPRIAPLPSSTRTSTKLTAEVVEPGLDDIPFLNYQWESNTGSGYQPVGANDPTLIFDSTQYSAPLIRLTVSDDDGGSGSYQVVAVFGTDAPDTITVTATGYSIASDGAPASSSVPGSLLWADRILVLGFGGQDVLDASALPSTDVAILDGGAEQDRLIGGAGEDIFYPNQGNDIVDGGAGNDNFFLTPNSTLTVIDTVGDNILDFSRTSFADQTGITFDLSAIRNTGSFDADLDTQLVSTAGNTEHKVAIFGNFASLIGSNFDDSLTAAAGSTIDGGAGGDTFYVTQNTASATIFGGADDDMLMVSGTNITDLSFSGDDGADVLQNIGTISGLMFSGGADDDVFQNLGTILGTLSFGGDDGIDVFTNTGSISTLVFSGGADDDIFLNNGTATTTLSFGGDADLLLSGTGSITSLVFSGDAGADIFANLGSITSLTFNGGADDDVFVNVGASTSLNFGGDDDVLLANTSSVGSITTLVFSGDDGADLLRNFGSLTNLTFSGGADDDWLQNFGTGSVGTLVFSGDSGADLLSNIGSLTSLNFGGGADNDTLLNYSGGSITSLSFSGDEGSDLLQNAGSIASIIFTGGADDDVFVNLGTVSTSLSFGGDAGADLLQNSGSILSLNFGGGADSDLLANLSGGTITSLEFGGDDGADVLQNEGSIATLNFGGGADSDVLQNIAGSTITTLFFGGDYQLNSAGDWVPIPLAADDGADSLLNSGTITSLVFRGGADDDLLANLSSGFISTLNFSGDDGLDVLRNTGSVTSLNFGGGADADSLINTGTVVGTLVFGGDLSLDANGTWQPLLNLSDDGADLLANYGSVNAIVFTGGADDDVLLNMSTGSVLTTLSFSGDTGADVLRNSGSVLSLVFSGGADDDLLVNTGSSLTSLDFSGDDGIDTLVNQSSVTTLVFTGGADDDLLLNTGSSITSLVFSGGADDDVLQNSGSNITSLVFSGDIGSDTLQNSGSDLSSLIFGGGADDDTLINTGTGITVLIFGGDIDPTTHQSTAPNLGNDTLILGGSGAGTADSTVLFFGDAGSDVLYNAATGFSSINFSGDDGADIFQNVAGSVTSLIFTGGADDDIFQNIGAGVSNINFSGDSGADSLFNTGANVSSIIFTGGADDDAFINTGTALTGLVFSGDDGADLLINTGTLVTGLTFSGGADDDIFQNTGAGLTALVFSGDAGNDRFWNRSTAANSSNLLFQGDSGADLLINDAGGVTNLTFSGGADDDALQNSGVNITGLVFTGGADDDTLVNTSAGAILSLSFGGDAGADILQNSGSLTSLNFGGGADGDVFVNWGSVTSLNFMGDGELTATGSLQQISSPADDGAETLVNFGSITTLVFSGGADDDMFINSGSVTSLNFSGGADDDTLQNNGSVTTLVFSGNADDDTLINNASGITSLVFNGDDGVDSLVNNGNNISSLVFNGGADADSLRIHGAGHGLIVFDGGADAAADTFNYSGTGATGSSVNFSGGPGNDVLSWRGSADTLLFNAGAGDDVSVIVGSGNLTLNGGDGDDTIYFQGNLNATVNVVESGGGSSDTSSDTLDFSSFTTSAINVDLRSTSPQPQSASFILQLSNGLGIENVVGTSGADVILGNARNNRIFGAQYSDGYGTPTGGSRGVTQWVLFDFDTKTDVAAGEHEYTPAERAAIAARVESIYRGPDNSNPWFDVRVALSLSDLPAGVSEYAIVYFNETPAFGRPGGLASEIDPGNLNLGGSAVVQVNGLLGGVITSADLEAEGGDFGADKGWHPAVSDEQVGAEKPAATSENFVLLSTKIAAHELAHLMGLRHNDSFGPIGFGVHDPPGVDGYNPVFPGPAAAAETFDHLLGTGASVGSDRFNDLRNLFFGEREAIKLALAFSNQSQTFTPEYTSAHNSAASAQPLSLVTVAVPNTLGSGLNDDKLLHVQMLSVNAEIAVNSATSKSESDWYSFTGTAGDILNLDLYSNSLTRYGTAADDYIDSIVRIWYVSDGQLTLVPWFSSTAVNDDIFEPTDSSITDLLLPSSGTYYIEVDTFSRDPGSSVFDPTNPTSPINPDNPSNILGNADLLKRFLDTRDDTDVGHYQLVISRFTAANTDDGVDTIIGYGGVDQINAGDGDDYSLTILAGTNTSATADTVFSRSISVIDRAATDWTGSTVDFGDGSAPEPVTFSAGGSASLTHTFTQNGTYTVTISVVDDIGQSASASFFVTITGGTTADYNVRIAGNTPVSGYDQSNINGTVDLNGANLNLNFSGFTESVPDGGTYLLINNDGEDAIIGRFANLEDGSIVSTNFGNSGKTARISYFAGDGNDLAIIVNQPTSSFTVADTNAVEFGVQINQGTLQFVVDSTVQSAVPIAGIQSLTLNGRPDRDDVLRLDFSGDNAVLLQQLSSLSINLGGNSSDDLIINAGGSNVSVNHGGTGTGILTLGNLSLPFAGLGTNTLYIEGTANLSLTFSDAVTNINFDDHSTAGQSTVAGVGFTTTQIQNPSQQLTVNLGSSDTTLAFNSMDAAFNPTDGIVINGGAVQMRSPWSRSVPVSIRNSLSLEMEEPTALRSRTLLALRRSACRSRTQRSTVYRSRLPGET